MKKYYLNLFYSSAIYSVTSIISIFREEFTVAVITATLSVFFLVLGLHQRVSELKSSNDFDTSLS